MASERVHQQGSKGTLRKHMPIRKISTRYTTKPPSGMPEFEMLKPSGDTTGVVVAIAEGRSSDESIEELPEPTTPEEHETQTPRPRTLPPPIKIPAKAHVRHEPKVVSAGPSPVSPSPPPSRAPSAADVPLPRSSTNTPAFDQKSGQLGEPEQTPVMRSMFPSYNPNIPLAKQEYAPNMTIVPPTNFNRRFSSNNPYFQQKNRSQSSLTPSLPATKEPKESPLRRSESLKRASAISTPEELLEMWNIANGQDFEQAAESYVLELSCEDLSLNHEIITFSSSNHPIYTLAASKYPAASVNVLRTHPSQTATEIPICSSELSNPSRQDPLVCSVFPKLAGLMALDQSSTIAVNHSMSRDESDILQNEAITRARDREASLLLWDADSNRYCIMHPTLLDDSATSVPIAITPNTSAPTLIIISAPETNTPLLTLDIQSLTLTLHARAITALPSLYTLDSLVISLLILLLHLHRSCAIPRTKRAIASPQQQGTPSPEDDPLYFPPPPPSLHSHRSRSQIRPKTSRSRSRAPSLFRSHNNRSAPSLAPSTTHSALASPVPWSSPNPGHYSATIVSTIGDHDRDIELGDLTPDGHSVVKQKPPKPLFGSDDQSLPAGTRAVLKFLYWVFEVVYWVLGVCVQVLAAAVVWGGKLVTKL